MDREALYLQQRSGVVRKECAHLALEALRNRGAVHFRKDVGTALFNHNYHKFMCPLKDRTPQPRCTFERLWARLYLLFIKVLHRKG